MIKSRADGTRWFPIGGAVAALLAAGCSPNWLDGASGAEGGPPKTPYEQGKTQMAAGQYGLAIQSFRRSLARDPVSLKALNGLAASYDLLGRPDLAERYYRQALVLDPKSVQTLNNLGYSLLLSGRFAEAREHLDEAAGLAPDNRVIAANLENLAHTEATTTVEGYFEGRPPAAERRDDKRQTRETQPPTVWIERTSSAVQTLVTRLDPELMERARARELEPRVVHAREPVIELRTLSLTRVDKASTPPAALRAVPKAKAPAATPVRRETGPAAPDRGATAAPASAPATEPSAALPRNAVLEVSNGAGRLRMAARMRAYLLGRGIETARLTNDESFANGVSILYYRPGFAEAAQSVAAALPLTPPLRPEPAQESDLRLVLGGDLLSFDRELIAQLTP